MRNHLSNTTLLAATAALGLIGVRAWRRRNEDDLRSQVVLITGGSRGLGFLLAREFGREGARIAICARDEPELERGQADLAAQGSVPHLSPYTSAKFAAVGLSEGLRAELAGEGISVTTIVPGLMRTGSYLNAHFKGRQEEDFTWFALGASLPFITMNAERAARQIVQATRRGEAERTLSLPAVLRHTSITLRLLAQPAKLTPLYGAPPIRGNDQ